MQTEVDIIEWADVNTLASLINTNLSQRENDGWTFQNILYAVMPSHYSAVIVYAKTADTGTADNPPTS